MAITDPQPFLSTAGGRIRCARCTAKSSRTKLQCGRPALKTSKTQKCQFHGGGQTSGKQTLEGRSRIAAAHYKHGESTKSARAEYSRASSTLNQLEDATRSLFGQIVHPSNYLYRMHATLLRSQIKRLAVGSGSAPPKGLCRTLTASSLRRRLGCEAIGQLVAGSWVGCPFGTSPRFVGDMSMLRMDTYSSKLANYLLPLFLYEVSKCIVGHLPPPVL